ncbi:hypothetical protein BG006_004826 [Podila minutissima]|uniref:Lysosomal dipeptide transporter MFSD1 n=1 Tax=Podila minutissima TaxID=64525 RepID=A0A9P5SNC2_9FUNG|nr:hypothetical protein BG006_004826 [Podila minutissima]
MLATACFVMFGNYYAFDNPASLNQPLQEYMGMSDDRYAYFLNILYTSYSLPNIVLPWLGGYASDRFGHRKLLLSLSATVAFGHMVVCLGVQYKYVPAMILGRVLFGAGESLAVAQSAITVKYFRGKELAMALGINLCVARLGSVLNDILTPYIWTLSNVPVAFWGGFVSCILSFITACLLVWLDSNYGSLVAPAESGFSRLRTHHSDTRFSLDALDSTMRDELHQQYDPATPFGKARDSVGEEISLNILVKKPKCGPSTQRASMGVITEYRSSIGGQYRRNTRHSTESRSGESDEDEDDFDLDESLGTIPLAFSTQARQLSSARQCLQELSGLLDYSQSFWVLFLITFLLVGVQVPFNSIHAGFLQMRWYHNDPQKAAQIMTVPDLLSAILVLPVGYFVDHYGQKSWLFMLCGLIIGFAHSILGLVSIATPVPALMALGISSAIGALFTSAIPVLVKSHQIATAYGISSSAMNMAFTLFPLIVAKLMTVDPSVYTYVEVFFASCGFGGFLLAVRLKCLDRYGDLDRREMDNVNGGLVHH